MNPSRPDYSIIIPVYFNEGCLVNAMRSLKSEVIDRNPDLAGEIIYVDDGSGDGSLNELISIRDAYPGLVTVVKLTRNFGQANAILAGYSRVKGKCVITMSADGQDPPGLINDMLDGYFREGYEVVICSRKGRDESAYRIVTSRIFYSLIKKLVFPDMPKGGFDFVLMGERALRVFLRNTDTHPFFQGQILWMGFRTKFIEYVRSRRISGESRWTFGKKLTYLIDGVLSFSFIPIRGASIMGIVLAACGFLYALAVFFAKIFYGNPIKGWAPLMIVILVIGGFQLLMLGVIGEYLWRTLSQVRNRDMYVIDTVYENKDRVADPV